MMNPEESYKYDATFHRVVDLMRAHLSVYEITPSELRQAAILAATMHEAQRVKPLFTRSYFPAKPWGGMEVFIDEAPAMFGGEQIDKSKWGVGMVGAPLSKPEHCHIFSVCKPNGDWICTCGISEVYYNWAYSKPKPSEDDLPF